MADESESLESFCQWRFGDFVVLARPNPPDMVIKPNNSEPRWLEHTKYPGTSAESKLLMDARVDPQHPPYLSAGMHEIIPINETLSLVVKKLENPNYEEHFKIYGPGILVVSLKSPLLGDLSDNHVQKLIHILSDEDEQISFQNISQGYFGEIALDIGVGTGKKRFHPINFQNNKN